MKYISLFSGIEAASVAWEPLGWEPVAFCEFDEFPSAVLAHRWPDVPNLGDITKVDWSDYAGKVDVVVGGSPCQSFSIAGNRAGLDGASGLMWEYVRCVREVRPRWFVWENVPGALSSGGGEDFRCLLESMDELVYGLAWRVLDAQFFGVAQRRRRVFLVGSLGDACSAEVLFESDGLRWDTQSSREKRQEIAGRTERGAGSGGCAGFGYKVSAGAGTIGYEHEIAPTLLAGRNDASVLVHDQRANRYAVRRLTPVECERLQGFPDGHTDLTGADHDALFERMAREDMDEDERKKLMRNLRSWCKSTPDGKRYKACGNSMAVNVMRWIGERIDMIWSAEECPERGKDSRMIGGAE